MNSTLFDMHEKTLRRAVDAIYARTYFSAYPEMPSGKIYGEEARSEGLAAYEARLGKRFEIDQPGNVGWVGSEISPYGPALGISYPKVDLDILLPAMKFAMESWKKAEVEVRVGVCLEILHRLNKQSFEMGQAVMHTTGQGGMMAFQAGGPHAQDRALEALAYAYEEMAKIPAKAIWSKRVGRDETVTLEKHFRIMPRGVAVTIGCSTFPTWNSYPGLFASLVTGNAVVVKPHPGAVLPLAITIQTIREVLKEQGFDPNLASLVVDTLEDPIAKDLLTRPEVKLIDYTGSSAFGDWVEDNAKQAIVFTEKAGVNSVIVDSIDNLKAVTGNLAFTLCLYSGQMCTTSQNIFIPKDGIETADGHISFDEFAGALVKAVDWFLSEPRRAAEVLGAIQNERTVARIDEARKSGCEVLRDSSKVKNDAFPEARVYSPMILKTDAGQEDLFMREAFGPICFVIATANTEESIALAAKAAKEHGAISCALYSTDDAVIEKAEDATADAGVPLSCNLTGSIWVNQSAAFSDYHVSGGNPSGNATLCDSAFVANRFRVVHSRKPVAVED